NTVAANVPTDAATTMARRVAASVTTRPRPCQLRSINLSPPAGTNPGNSRYLLAGTSSGGGQNSINIDRPPRRSACGSGFATDTFPRSAIAATLSDHPLDGC